ncbi:tRNA uracil 4-sulfurtransferase ThiI [Liquorilactobacillus oeni]|uniref:Probable tRNA sulfurtransferase n=1 Tax=Liquorilactobacillus oeni DSM 19972 TaxID=1423777 RepID=A0A0R1MGA3_9LACO|nr:tRNA uracil 4-sulfurtransferase ThiI [Liquorilactobacillus oeni]KRL04194.1 thiamine biosynthesis protein [Liquorilactobacillus oeni DSM 19972]
MRYTEIMVRYGELSTKGKNRRAFIDRLGFNVRETLHDFPELVVKANRDRMHIQLHSEDGNAVMERLQLVFGIQNFSPSVRVEQNVEDVKETAVKMIKEQYQEGMTFKINTRRSDHDFKLDTNEMNDLLGGYVLRQIPGIKVKMKSPDLTLRVEVRKNGIFLSNRTIDGAGGLPVGTAGKGVLMMSGGIDSPVAGYLAMKRGVAIEMIHFFSPPYTSEQALNKAKELTAKLAPFTGKIKFIEVPFTEIQETVKSDVPAGYLMTVQRRFMLRIADLLAHKREDLAIFNGESLGQVASQTLESMVAINDVTSLPVLRPVVSLDKNEIIDIAQKIGTFELSVMPFEDCCTIFAPPSPKTKPRLERARLYESRLDVDNLIKRAIAGIKVTEIRSGEKFLAENSNSFAELL